RALRASPSGAKTNSSTARSRGLGVRSVTAPSFRAGRSRSNRRAARSDGVHDDEIAGRVVRHPVRHAAEEEALGARHALRSDDDEVGAGVLSRLDQLLGRVTVADAHTNVGETELLGQRAAVVGLLLGGRGVGEHPADLLWW